MFDLTGRIALVTGAGQGMGEGITAALVAQGASVAVNDLDADRAAVAVDRLRSTAPAGATVIAAPFDVTYPAAVEAGVQAAEAELAGGIDILVNNAGVPAGMAISPFRELDPSEWARYVDLNLYGSMNCIRAVLDGMCDRGWGRIVQISSGAGQTGVAFGISLYGASKSGIEGLIRHLSQEVARNGVTANSLELGLMENAGGTDEGALRSLARSVPIGRLGRPADVGSAVAYLASDEASWMTGQTLHLDGGSTTT